MPADTGLMAMRREPASGLAADMLVVTHKHTESNCSVALFQLLARPALTPPVCRAVPLFFARVFGAAVAGGRKRRKQRNHIHHSVPPPVEPQHRNEIFCKKRYTVSVLP